MASGIKDDTQKRVLLSGSDVQDIFATMEDTGDDKEYEVTLTKLNDYFKVKKNIVQAVQEKGESVNLFVSRLKQLAVTCEFSDHKDDFIRDQVIDKCTSTALRRTVYFAKYCQNYGSCRPTSYKNGKTHY